MKNAKRGSDFEQEVELLLRLKGYVVSRNELISGTQIDLVAQRNSLLDNLCFIVECTDRDVAVGVDLVKQKAAVLLSLNDSRYLFRLIFIARNGFTAEAKAFANTQPNILLLTLNDLENQLIDFGPYVNWYIYNYETSFGIFKEGRLYDNYVELTGKDEQGNIISSLTEEANRWLEDKDNNLLFLLGEYGSGKTSFGRYFAYKLINEKYRGLHEQRFIPILINLREYRNAFNIQQVITDTLINTHGVDLPSFAAFERICSSGKIFLILDGFDEMTDRSDKQTLIDCFNQIYLLASLNVKIILTCRSNFFHNHSDILELLKQFSINVPLAGDTARRVIQLTFEHQGRIVYIEKLNQTQIREFITKRFGADAESVFSTMESIHDLSDLSTRPVLLDMILTTLPELSKSQKRINSAALYEHYTNKWTARDEWRVSIPLRVRQDFCEVLGWLMHNARTQEIEYSLLERVMIRSLHQMAESESQFEKFKNDIQTCSFLVRVGMEDTFRFAHKSFLEYFVASNIITKLAGGLPLTKTSIEDFDNDQTEKEETLDEPSEIAWGQRGFVIGLGNDFTSLRYILTPHFFLPEREDTIFSSAYKTITKRVKSSDGFLTLIRTEIARSWPVIESDTALKTHLEEQMRDIFKNQDISKVSEDLGISEEIATFAIEYLENTDISLQKFILGLNQEHSIVLFSDILRIGQSTEFARSNGEFMKNYVKTGEQVILKISFCAALAKVPDFVDLQLVKDSREQLTDEGWSYFLFELASRSSDYLEIIKECFKWDDLRTIDKVICVYGIRDAIPEEQRESLIKELMDSSNDKEKLLGLKLCQPMRLSYDALLKLTEKALQKEVSKEVVEEAISILNSLEGDQAWRTVRRLLAKEKDPSIKLLLKRAEQSIRDATSSRKNRVNWDRVKTNRVVRDKMWSFLRS